MVTTATQGAYLNYQQRTAYDEAGFLFPLRVLSSEQAGHYRHQLEAMESEQAEAELPRPLHDYIRVHSDVVMPMAAELAFCPAVLDAVESILGPNLLVWGAEFFIKEANSPQVVSMHQDLTYWGFGATSQQVTAWIALSPSTRASGCVELVHGSHQNEILPHTDTYADNNILSRGQEVAVEVPESDRTHVELAPGEMSLHHGLAIHGSRPNTSNDRRIGFAIRYVTPEAGREAATREYAMLVRGQDDTGIFQHYQPPEALFSQASMDVYEQIRQQQAQTLGAGMDRSQELFGGGRG